MCQYRRPAKRAGVWPRRQRDRRCIERSRNRGRGLRRVQQRRGRQWLAVGPGWRRGPRSSLAPAVPTPQPSTPGPAACTALSAPTGSLAGSNVINGASASRLYVAFIGGAGSATVYGGEAGASVFGVDGTDATYVDTMAGAPGGFLVANGSAAGGETLNAAGSTTNDSLFAAQGNVSVVAGSGTDFLDVGANTGTVGGAGTVVGGDTLVAGGGTDVMFFCMRRSRVGRSSSTSARCRTPSSCPATTPWRGQAAIRRARRWRMQRLPEETRRSR